MDVPSSPTTRSPDDAQAARALEAAFARGEVWSFEAAYHAYGNILVGAAYGVLHNRRDAEDCVHDVLVRLWHARNAYHPNRGHLRSFLAVCVRNEALSRLRKERNRGRIDEAFTGSPQASHEEHSIDSMMIEQGLATLSAPQRQALQLAYFDGLTHEQIATKLGIPLGTIKSRLSDALRKMRIAIAEDDRS